ncbi:secretion system protein E [Caulobacter endophyticus]|uniref:Secretion system protein E n=2 Tax=Caulobacter endophyticus TaxID=2172652 RepID=A0A2T9JYN2_9CAUL|nr:secretion system protein E [Caulobacter endophyticus]
MIARLLHEERIDQNLLRRAAGVCERTGLPIEAALNQMGAISDETLVDLYCEASGCLRWSPQDEPGRFTAGDLPAAISFLQARRILPLRLDGEHLVVAAADPLDDEGLAGLAFSSGAPLRILVARPADYRREASNLFEADAEDEIALDERKLSKDVQAIADAGADSIAARILKDIVEMAVARRASDVHFEPRRHDLRIRLRIDGQLVEHQLAASDLSAPLVSRLKVLADLDVGERRLPQDGRASFVVEGRPVDVRVSVLPAAFGETAVLRILDRDGLVFDYPSLGFSPSQVALLESVAHSPHGLFLVTGPTGSGKTTTLYALLETLRQTPRKILSIEDPIEYHFRHVVQVQAAPQIGLSFASALRAFLRQDPDVILVGEIRDAETAEVAVQAALTGHLVLASLHANHALGVVPRLLDMGVEPYQLAAALRGAMAQRLVRRLCPDCAARRPLTAAEAAFAPSLHDVHEGSGCANCGHAGFKGRIAVAEGFVCDEGLAAAIAARVGSSELQAHAQRGGLGSLHADALEKVRLGQTSLRDVMALGRG